MSKKIEIKCGYCGIHWTPEYYTSTPACPKCNEKENLTARELNVQTTDVFGYRFDTPFEKELPKPPENQKLGYASASDMYDEQYLGGD